MKNYHDHSHRNANLLLLLASAIWGFAFVAQRLGMEHMGPLAFNAIRFAIGALVLMPLLFFGLPGQKPAPLISGQKKHLLLGGLMTGIFIFGGASGLKTRRELWFGAALASVGLYLLSGKAGGGIALGDGLVLVGTLFWASHVLAVGWLVHRVNPLALAVLQFLVCSVFSGIGALIFEDLSQVDLQGGAIPILYAGVLSVGVAYTLQILGQRKAHPAHAALILSMEGVFAALGGWLILTESLSARGLAGCALMLGGIILAQWDSASGKDKSPTV